MVFSSLLFLGIFLPLVILAYNLLPSVRDKNIILVIASIIFYAWGEPKLVILLVLTAYLGYLAGLAIEKSNNVNGLAWLKKPALVVAVVVSLGSLGVFKYSGFVVENLSALIGKDISFVGFALPLGISFYTFQILTYVIDLYRGEIKVQKSFLDFLCYVTMFPQLVAGPIVRYIDIEKELYDRKVRIKDFEYGALRFCQGLMKKVVLANNAGEVADRLLGGDLSESSVATAWLGIIMYTFQIYFDFSGYSDLAIGMGRFFGFTFMENFKYPYIATSITDFWRRWHISLSTFFRDYVYIPLGGNRKRHIFNIFVVWMLTGLWHGASWNFILWGIFYGILLIIEKKAFGGAILKLPSWLGHIYTMAIVIMGWALFYFTDFAKLKSFFVCAFGGYGNSLIDYVAKSTFVSNIWLILVLALCSTPVLRILFKKVCSIKFIGTFVPAAAIVVSMALCYALLVGQSYNAFLYFRF